jgi:alkaline phosphatase
MPAEGSIGEFIWRRLTRRGLFRAGGGGVASAVIIGVGGPTVSAAPYSASAGAAGPLASTQRELVALDPHALTGLVRPSAAARGTGIQVRILPIDRAKSLAGARFDLRVEALGWTRRPPALRST